MTKDVEPAEALDRGLDNSAYFWVDRNVDPHADEPAGQALRLCLDRADLLSAVHRRDDICPLAREEQRSRATDAAARADHDRHFACEPHLHLQ